MPDQAKEASPLSMQPSFNPNLHGIISLAQLCLRGQVRTCQPLMKRSSLKEWGTLYNLFYATSNQFRPQPYRDRQCLQEQNLSCSSTSNWLKSWLCLLQTCSSIFLSSTKSSVQLLSNFQTLDDISYLPSLPLLFVVLTILCFFRPKLSF